MAIWRIRRLEVVCKVADRIAMIIMLDDGKEDED